MFLDNITVLFRILYRQHNFIHSYIQVNIRDLRDKKMADKLINIRKDDTQDYIFCRLQLLVEM